MTISDPKYHVEFQYGQFPDRNIEEEPLLVNTHTHTHVKT